MSEYKPGTVAVATVRGVPNVRIVRGDGHWAIAANTDDFIMDRHSDGLVADVRPLVVLDLDEFDRAEAAECVRGHRADDCRVVERIADQIEAQTRPPKPPEPQGLGAVVEDAEGERWVRLDSDMYPWFAQGSRDFSAWDHIAAVRVLSEGVTDA